MSGDRSRRTALNYLLQWLLTNFLLLENICEEKVCCRGVSECHDDDVDEKDDIEDQLANRRLCILIGII